MGGIAASSLGHAHPAVDRGGERQVETLGHTSNLAIHEPGVRLAQRLVALVRGDLPGLRLGSSSARTGPPPTRRR